MSRTKSLLLVALGLALLPSLAEAQRTQRPTRRRQATIEIRGQVPTPQVVTVRPRAAPAYNRRVLVPNFYDHDFWPSILPAYQLVPERQLTGRTGLATPGGATGPGTQQPQSTTPPDVTPGGTTPQQSTTPATQPARPQGSQPPSPPSTTGTAPATRP